MAIEESRVGVAEVTSRISRLIRWDSHSVSGSPEVGDWAKLNKTPRSRAKKNSGRRFTGLVLPIHAAKTGMPTPCESTQ